MQTLLFLYIYFTFLYIYKFLIQKRIQVIYCSKSITHDRQTRFIWYQGYHLSSSFTNNNLTLTFHIPCTVSQYCFRYSLLLSLVYTPFLRLKLLNKTSVVQYKCPNATKYSLQFYHSFNAWECLHFCIKLSQHCTWLQAQLWDFNRLKRNNDLGNTVLFLPDMLRWNSDSNVWLPSLLHDIFVLVSF